MRWVMLGLLALGGCEGAGPAGAPLGLGGESSTSAGANTSSTTGEMGGEASSSTTDAETSHGSTSGGSSTASPPSSQACRFPSSSFGQPMQELDVMDPGSSFRLSFVVPGVPSPENVESAALHFRGYDLDHPGEEGLIYVNGGTGQDLPANAAYDNAESNETLDVTGLLVEGSNTIEFGPGPLERSFFRIGDVELEVVTTQSDCETPPDSDSDSGTGNGVEQTVHYTDATYTGRNNWVWRCQGPIDYAFTAANPKHIPSDCGNAYDPDGSAHGTATFYFQDVVEDDYTVEVHAYHTFNRNPAGARVVVDGVVGTVDQRTAMEGEAYPDTASWGVAHLSGDIDIVLDSAQGGYASDAVAWIRIVPVP